MAVIIVQGGDLDDNTIKIIDGQTKPKDVRANVVFGEAEVQVQANIIQSFLFRRLENGNRLMVCTGFQYNDQWYGDRPDNGGYLNPFSGEIELIGGKAIANKAAIMWGLDNNGRRFLELVGAPMDFPRVVNIDGVDGATGSYRMNPIAVNEVELNGQPALRLSYTLPYNVTMSNPTSTIDMRLAQQGLDFDGNFNVVEVPALDDAVIRETGVVAVRAFGVVADSWEAVTQALHGYQRMN